MANQYDGLLTLILDKSTPDPQIVVYNETHMANLRAGLSRAKQRLDTLRSFTGEESLDNYMFKYTKDEKRPHLITISLVPKQEPFEIVYVTEEKLGETYGTEVSDDMGES